MNLKKCASKIWKARKQGRQGNKRPVTVVGEYTRRNMSGNLPELPHIRFHIVIGQLSNPYDIVQFPNQLPTLYTNVKHWEELIDFIHNNGGQKEVYTLTLMFKFSVTQDKLNEYYIGEMPYGQSILNPCMGRFCSTIAIQILSSWNMATIPWYFGAKRSRLLEMRLPSTKLDQQR